LSGERYIAAAVTQTEYEVVQLTDVCDVNPRKSELDELPGDTRVSFVSMKDLAENSSSFAPQEERILDDVRSGAYTYFRDGDVLIAKVTPCFENGKAGVARNLLNGVGFGSSEYYVLRPSKRLLSELLYHFIISRHFRARATPAMTGTGGLQRVPKSIIEEFQIPVPPLEIQHQIVAEIEGYQKVIDGARQVLDGYRPSVVVDPSWPVERLGDIFQTKSGTTPSRDNPEFFQGGKIPWVKTLDLRDGGLQSTDECVTDLALAQTHLEKMPIGTVLVAMYGGLKQIGRTGVLEIEAASNQAMTALLPSPRVDPYFLNFMLIAKRDYWKSVANSTRKDPNITKSDVLNFKLSLPDLPTQHAIVAEIQAEQALVNANRELMRRMEAKIKVAIDRVWGSEAQSAAGASTTPAAISLTS